jgi:hypothetical protein
MKTLNEAYSSLLSTGRRYEVWFLRLGLAKGAGAWWFRYLLMNPKRGGCAGHPRGQPVQVWATWFPPEGGPQSFLQGFPLEGLDLSAKGRNPFHFQIGKHGIEDNSCHGALEVQGHSISWDLRYNSTFRTTLSDKGWIGFSRTPHSDARFLGRITLDDRSFVADPLGFGVQGHNCGYRHRSFWTWGHAYLLRPDGGVSTVEALVYDMPLGLVFRKAVLWHDGKSHVFRSLKEKQRDPERLQWELCCVSRGCRWKLRWMGAGPTCIDFPTSRLTARAALKWRTIALPRQRFGCGNQADPSRSFLHQPALWWRWRVSHNSAGLVNRIGGGEDRTLPLSTYPCYR